MTFFTAVTFIIGAYYVGNKTNSKSSLLKKIIIGIAGLLSVLFFIVLVIGIAFGIVFGAVTLMTTFITPYLHQKKWNTEDIALLEVGIITPYMFAVLTLFPKIVYLIPHVVYEKFDRLQQRICKN